MDNHPAGLTAEEIRDLVGTGPTMLEIGSHDGSSTVEFLKAMPNIRLYCFEPDQRPITRFKETIGDDPRVTLYEVAVSDVDGDEPFYASTGKAGHMDDWDYSGSLRKPTGHLAHSPEIGFKEPVDVPCIRLDSWFFATLSSGATIDFAWIDIQGGQQAFLDGSRYTLPATRYVYIEAHHEPLYEGETTQNELIAMLPHFEPLGIYGQDNLLFRNRYVNRKS